MKKETNSFNLYKYTRHEQRESLFWITAKNDKENFNLVVGNRQIRTIIMVCVSRRLHFGDTLFKTRQAFYFKRGQGLELRIFSRIILICWLQIRAMEYESSDLVTVWRKKPERVDYGLTLLRPKFKSTPRCIFHCGAYRRIFYESCVTDLIITRQRFILQFQGPSYPYFPVELIWEPRPHSS